MLLQRDVPRAAKYYSLLGFRLRLLTEAWAELDTGGTTVVLKQAGCAAARLQQRSTSMSTSVSRLHHCVTTAHPVQGLPIADRLLTHAQRQS